MFALKNGSATLVAKHIRAFFLLGLLCGSAAVRNADAQALSWTTPVTNGQTSIHGLTDREGVGTANANGQMYVTWTSNNGPDASGGYAVYIGYNSDGGPGFAYAAGITASGIGTSPGLISSRFNPSIVADNLGNLYVGYTDPFNSVRVVTSGDGGFTWSSVLPVGSRFGDGAASNPTLAFFNGQLAVAWQGPSNSLNLSLMNLTNDHTVTSTVNLPGYKVAFAPGLFAFNGTLYVAYQDVSSHNIDIQTTTNGVNFAFNSAATSDQTSTSPSLATHNGFLYLGFRTNDGDHKFLYKYTNTGSSFTKQDPHYTMGGPPSLMEASNGLAGNPSLNGHLFNSFAANSTSTLYYYVSNAQ